MSMKAEGRKYKSSFGGYERGARLSRYVRARSISVSPSLARESTISLLYTELTRSEEVLILGV